MNKTNLKFFIELPDNLKQAIADCQAEIQRQIESVQAERDALRAKIGPLQKVEAELTARINELYPHIAESDETSIHHAGAVNRLAAVQRNIADLRAELESIRPATLEAAAPVLEAIRQHWSAQLDRLVDEALREVHFPSNFFGGVSQHCGVHSKTLPFLRLYTNVAATPENLAELQALFQIALNGRVSPELDQSPAAS